MDFSKFNLTPLGQECISRAEAFAEEVGHLKVIDLHLLCSVLEFPHDNIDYVFKVNEINKEGLLKSLHAAVADYQPRKRKHKVISKEIMEIVEQGAKISESFGDEWVGIDHIFAGILVLREEVRAFLQHLEIDVEKFTDTLMAVLSAGIPNEPVSPSGQPSSQSRAQPSSQNPYNVAGFVDDMYERIKKRGTFEIAGREDEMQQMYEVLLRKNKSNVILVGEAGTGKTAIVEGIVEKVIKRECPDLLINMRVLALDLNGLISGTTLRGQMEEKIRRLIDHLEKNPNIVLFIDEIHNIVNIGGNSEGGFDLGNILKPALSRGTISCIGATTNEEYKKYFEVDSALNRRFEKVSVKEPTKDETLELLRTVKSNYESYHKVSFDEGVLGLIVKLCEAHQPQKRFPDKAFDILDEAGAKTKMAHIVRPQEAKDIEEKMKDEELPHNDFLELQQEHIRILTEWGAEMKESVFSVDKSTVFDIFARKLNCSAEELESETYKLPEKKIGFV